MVQHRSTTPTKTVEANVTKLIVLAARAKAEEQSRQFSTVARAVLTRASRNAVPAEEGEGITQRKVIFEETRVRFRMDADAYEIIRKRLAAAQISMKAALSDGLENYAQTGEI